MNRFLRDDEKLRLDLLSEIGNPLADRLSLDPQAQTEPAVDPLVGRLALVPEDDQLGLETPARISDPHTPGPRLSQPVAKAPEARSAANPEAFDRVMQGIYHAGTGTPLPASFHQRDKGDLLLDVKRRLYEAQIAKAGRPTGAAGDPFKDPDSRQSIATQESTLTGRPDVVESAGGPERLKRLSHNQIKDIATMLDRDRGLTDTIRGRKVSEEDRDLSRDLAAQGQKLVHQRWSAKEMHELGDKTSKYSELVHAMKKIDELAPGIMFGEVPEGYALNDWQKFLTQVEPTGLGKRYANVEAVKLQGAYHLMKELITRMRTGAVINDNEEDNFNKALNMAWAAGPQALAAVLPMYRQALGDKLAAFQAPYYLQDEDQFQRWAKESRNLTYKDPFFSGGSSASSPESETPADATEVDPAEAARALGTEAAERLQSDIPTTMTVKPPAPSSTTAPSLTIGKPQMQRKQPKPGDQIKRPDGSVWLVGEDGKSATMIRPPNRK